MIRLILLSFLCDCSEWVASQLIAFYTLISHKETTFNDFDETGSYFSFEFPGSNLQLVHSGAAA